MVILGRQSIGPYPAQVNSIGEPLLSFLVEWSEAHEATEGLLHMIGWTAPPLVEIEESPGRVGIVAP